MSGIASGRLRHRVELQKQNRSTDRESGDVTISWSTFATAWAAVEPLSVREFIAGQAVQSQVTARVTVRHREGLNASMRILFRGRIYNPQGWLPDPDSGLEHLTAPCSEGVNDGR